VAKFITIVAIDDFGISSSVPKTSAFIDNSVAIFEKKEREKAAKVVAPKF
jgi:hypothetical protein